jgi:hypothetical protein
MSESELVNISDIKRKNILGDKTIYDIYFHSGKAYLSTGFGIVVFNLNRNEVEDSYFIGTGGSNLKVTATSITGGFIYASTPVGLMRAAINSDLRNFNSWSAVQGLPPGSNEFILNFEDKLLAVSSDTIYRFDGSRWNVFYRGSQLTGVNISEGKLLVTETSSTNAGRLVVVNSNGVVEQRLQSPGNLQLPVSSIIKNGNYWIADQFSGLIKTNGQVYERIIPNSPFEKASGEMIVHNGKVFVAAGEINSAWNYTYNRFGLY